MFKRIRKIFVFVRRKSYPLRPTLVLAVVLAILLAIASVGIPGYLSSKKAVRLLWGEVGKNIAQSSTEYVTQYFHDAPHLVDFIADLYERQELDLNNTEQLMNVAYEGLHDNPHFVWFFLARLDGSIVGAYRDMASCEIRGHRGEIRADSPDPQKGTYNQDFKLEEGEWVALPPVWDNYDPRKRSWWQGASEHPEGEWSQPYLFYDEPRRIGITFTLGQRSGKQTVGYWAIDYQTDFLHNYLRKIVAGTSGRILIIDEEDRVIADSKTHEILALQSIYEVIKDNPWLAEVWKESKEGSGTIGGEYGDYLIYIDPFSPAPRIKWKVLSIVDKSDFFGPIDQAVWIAIAIATPLSLFLISISAIFFGRISERLKELAFEMNMVRNLHFSPKDFSENPSFVREVNMMGSALDRMKIGLNAFSKYVPRDLVFELIKSGQQAVLGGKKKELTFLFTDLANFTRLSEEAPPDLLVKILGEYLEKMTGIIEREGGVVDLYIGDSIFAFWGAPSPAENHPFLACQAALLMRNEFETLWKNIPEQYSSLLKQRIGINTGTAIVGNVGSPDRLSYSAIGDAVNLASRLEGLNKFYGTSILVGEETARIVQNMFVLRPVDWVAVKGRVQVTLLHELVGERGKVEENVLQAIQTYQQALTLYRNRDFTQAAQQFEAANQLFGGQDSPSQKLAERCRQYQGSPPPEGWNGALTMQEK